MVAVDLLRQRAGFHQRRWMLFVDGENFTMSAQRVTEHEQLSLPEGAFYQRDTFVWFPRVMATQAPGSRGELPISLQTHAVRAHYYASVQGDAPTIERTSETLWQLGFTPKVFKRDRTRGRSKGVDIALATDILGYAFRDTFDVALLYAGDGDYVPLVEEVKRLGKGMYVCFFQDSGLNTKLRIASDMFLALDGVFLDEWRRYLGDS